MALEGGCQGDKLGRHLLLRARFAPRFLKVSNDVIALAFNIIGQFKHRGTGLVACDQLSLLGWIKFAAHTIRP
ncbi:hypothetical protein [Mycolicibacterium komossense]|uniref:Transposase n=1 Tax=Mycolicibacterium komossense TaxID=1779 RepID=A0ABT3CDZ0_9MYCO|nr:hypothetical protein [Mycolicibacterium komossense]MCV7227687.1 hypothetical protein [Mycolicibacterium komossense]